MIQARLNRSCERSRCTVRHDQVRLDAAPARCPSSADRCRATTMRPPWTGSVAAGGGEAKKPEQPRRPQPACFQAATGRARGDRSLQHCLPLALERAGRPRADFARPNIRCSGRNWPSLPRPDAARLPGPPFPAHIDGLCPPRTGQPQPASNGSRAPADLGSRAGTALSRAERAPALPHPAWLCRPAGPGRSARIRRASTRPLSRSPSPRPAQPGISTSPGVKTTSLATAMRASRPAPASPHSPGVTATASPPPRATWPDSRHPRIERAPLAAPRPRSDPARPGNSYSAGVKTTSPAATAPAVAA